MNFANRIVPCLRLIKPNIRYRVCASNLRLNEVRLCQTVSRRCFASEDLEDQYNAVAKKTEPVAESKQTKHESPSTRPQMKQLSPRNKKYLFLAGKWKSWKDIPDAIDQGKYNNAMWIIRIRIASLMMIVWVVACLIVTKFGRNVRTEHEHRIVMQQYWATLTDEEKVKFLEEYNIDPRKLE